ncbi:hypothetical protein EZV62_004472 [Acer yangbiense]|uniref:Uncharacterized protein n=1 Tax=Acer yangbiense TaxID=1000413 RepID=A0A5C7IJG8_9ROSI|nr:hypothetical protein EZV62_004472 [Acer yangbiense]
MFMNLMPENQSADIERYCDLNKPKTTSTRDSIYQFLQISASNFPQELVKGFLASNTNDLSDGAMKIQIQGSSKSEKEFDGIQAAFQSWISETSYQFVFTFCHLLALSMIDVMGIVERTVEDLIKVLFLRGRMKKIDDYFDEIEQKYQDQGEKDDTEKKDEDEEDNDEEAVEEDDEEFSDD